MCGIAACYNKDFKTTLRYLETSFKRLEYRGYDACGYCLLYSTGWEPAKTKYPSKGTQLFYPEIYKFVNEQPKFDIKENKDRKLLGGLIHTRWASVGKNSKENTHPFQKNQTILAHNGNFNKHRFNYFNLDIEGETDSELLCWYIDSCYSYQDKPINKIFESFSKDEQVSSVYFNKNLMYAINLNGSLYYTLDGYIASDPICFKNFNNKYFILEHKEYIKCGPNNHLTGNKIHEAKKIYTVDENEELESNMFTEINRQVPYIRNFDPKINIQYKDIPRIVMLACGSSYYAAKLGKKYLEDKCHIPVDVEYASEFLTQSDKYITDTLFIVISQSGETKDTIDAINHVKSFDRDYPTLAICNRENSALTHIVDQVIYTNCGIENGVAATISFTGQVLTLLGLAKYFRADNWDRKHLEDLAAAVQQVLDEEKDALLLSSKEELYYFFNGNPNIIILGTEHLWPIAQEAALKIKEITYTHCEAIPAGEMKHGPLALIDNQMCTFLLLTNYTKLDKVFFNAREILARNGKLVIITDYSLNIPEDIKKQSIIINVPTVFQSDLQPLIHLVFMQIFAAQYGTNLGVNINRPRSLSKSITV